MKTAQARVKANADLSRELKLLKDLKPSLVFAFGSKAEFSPGGLAGAVTGQFPGALVIGCSTAGEISNDGVYDDTMVVTASHFDKPDFRPAWAEISSMEDSRGAGARFAKQLPVSGLKAIFILSRGLQVNGSALIEGIRDVVGKDVILTGGLAGDGARFESTYTLLDGEIRDNRLVGFGIYGEQFEVGYGSMGGWAPFGPVRRVTKSHQNVLFELDGQPALDIYKKYLGHRAEQLPSSGLMYPFAILKDNQDETGIIRTILAIDEKEKSVTLAGDIPVNGLVRLMHTTNDGLVKGARTAAEFTQETLGKQKHAAGDSLGILISCVGRKLIMGDEIEDELEAVRDVLGDGTMAGFYSYGEICAQSKSADCKLHNQTMTITYITEKKAA